MHIHEVELRARVPSLCMQPLLWCNILFMAKMIAALYTHHVHVQNTVCQVQRGLHEAEAAGQQLLLVTAPADAQRH